MNQVILPIDLEVMLAENDIALMIHAFVESIPDEIFETYYQHYGRPQYHPRMMFSLLLCAYFQGVYSGRKIEGLVSDSVRMMWLTQGEKPNFRTINRFRVHPFMSALLQSAFVQFRSSLLNSGLVQGEALYIDGTKIEADANKFTFVWKKSIQNYDHSLNEKSLALYHQMLKDELLPDLVKEMKDELTLEELEAISQRLVSKTTDLEKMIDQTKDIPKRKQLRKKKSIIHQLKKKYLDFSNRKKKYQEAYEIFGQRNSYSKTDPEATFMRMKDDYMKNGQLKAGYNVQAASENQYVLAYQVFPNPTDTKTLIPFLQTMKKSFELPSYIVADAGYGSEENYQYILDEEERVPLITYNMYHKESRKSYKKQLFRRENWPYIAEDDYFVCPNQRRILFSHYSTRKDRAGFKRDFKIYECEDCRGCPVRNKCTKVTEGKNRKIQINPSWEYYKANIRTLLKEEKAGSVYRQRKIDIEPVFGNLKRNMKFDRFHVRGTQKISNELGLCFLAHNFSKLMSRCQKYQGKKMIQTLLEG